MTNASAIAAMKPPISSAIRVRAIPASADMKLVAELADAKLHRHCGGVELERRRGDIGMAAAVGNLQLRRHVRVAAAVDDAEVAEFISLAVRWHRQLERVLRMDRAVGSRFRGDRAAGEPDLLLARAACERQRERPRRRAAPAPTGTSAGFAYPSCSSPSYPDRKSTPLNYSHVALSRT